MDEPQTSNTTTILPGFFIGGGSAILVSGVGFLQLALQPAPPEDTEGILTRGFWLGPALMLLGLMLAVVGWRWLRGAMQSQATRQAATDALLGVFMLYAVVQMTREHWLEAIGLALSVGIVLAVSLRSTGRDPLSTPNTLNTPPGEPRSPSGPTSESSQASKHT